MTNEIQTPTQVAAPFNSDVDRKRRIHSEIVEDFLNIFEKMTEDQAKDVIRLIAKGSIRHLTIKY